MPDVGAEVKRNKTLKSLEKWKKTLTTRIAVAEKFGEADLVQPFKDHMTLAKDVVLAILQNPDEEESNGEHSRKLLLRHTCLTLTYTQCYPKRSWKR